MRIESFKYFITIAEGSTFLDAAFDHNISQSSLSKAINHLENEFGVKLFDRSHYPVTLTKAGQQLYSDLKELIPGCRKLHRHMKVYSQRHDVSCCVVPSYTIFGLRYIFDRFSDLHPKIPLHLTRSRDQLLAAAALEKDEFDFCVIHKPFLPLPNLNMTVLADDALYVLLPARHPLASSAEVSLSNLYNETFLTSGWSYTILRDLGEIIKMPPLSIEKNMLRESIINSISFGKGVALFYQSDILPFKLNNIVACRLSDIPHNPLVLATPSRKQLTLWEKTFRDFLLSVFSEA
jgi:DNA-binding transcriptional LysR family regulator